MAKTAKADLSQVHMDTRAKTAVADRIGVEAIKISRDRGGSILMIGHAAPVSINTAVGDVLQILIDEIKRLKDDA